MIRRTANISLSRTRAGVRARIFISLGPIEEESGRPSGRGGLILLARNPSPGTLVSSGHTRTTTSIRDVSVPTGCTWRSERSNQFHLPATFTWIVCGASSRRVPGFRRARHFTYAAGCPRANVSGANVTLLNIRWISLLRISAPGSFCRRRCTAFRASSIHAAPVGTYRGALAPLNRKAAY